jgi:hypothetical protein
MYIKKFNAFILLIVLIGWLASACQKQQSNFAIATVDSVDYNLHIRPILSDRCFICHGPDANQRKADLRLDTREGALAAFKDNPNAHGIIPGNANASEVYKRLITTDTSLIMPPVESNLSLTPNEISLIKKWIDQGAVYKKHWAFIPAKKVAIPEHKDHAWPYNAIDHFILQKLEHIGLQPSKESDKERLLKRVSFDLTGLPPSLIMQERFLNDPSPSAYENMVDELLANPAYGEKFAAYWMDIARYADSHGYQDDGLRTMWPWRDWVIHAFNENYPYEKFVTWQLAGDLFPNPSKEQRLATGFNRNHKITQEGGVIDEEYRIEYVTDRTNTFGKAFLALTLECAKCHDHKYDPISQKDYFSTFAFFNQVPEKGLVGDIFVASLADPPFITITNEDVNKILTFINKKDSAEVSVMVMEDLPQPRATYLLERGEYDKPTERVWSGLPSTIMPFDSVQFGSNRLGLAKWLVDPKNPLTSRVFVNRMWQELFGNGFVKTSGDFGMQGDLPSHPELLDWLAIDFMEHGWDIKRLLKQMVMSSTYRQSSVITEKSSRIDPDNVWLSRGPRLRMSAETIRDMALATSGLLVSEIGGPSVKGYQPKGLWEMATSGRGVLATYVQDHGEKLYRRGLYTFIKRTVPPPNMLVFDASNRDQCEVSRLRTNTPLQALVILNDPIILESARVFAERLLQQNDNAAENIRRGFKTIVCRNPKEEEMKILLNYFSEVMQSFEEAPEQAKKIIQVGEYPHVPTLSATKFAALMQVLHTIYNMEESITKS